MSAMSISKDWGEPNISCISVFYIAASLKMIEFKGRLAAQSVEHTTLNLGVMSSNPTLGVEFA